MKVILSTSADGSVAVTSFNWPKRAKQMARVQAAHEQAMRDWAARIEACKQAKDAQGAAEAAPAIPEILAESENAFLARMAANQGIASFVVIDHEDLPPALETVKDAEGADVHIDLQSEWKLDGGKLNAKGRADKVAANNAKRDQAG